MSAVRSPKRLLDKSPQIIVDGHRGGYTALGYRSATVANREGRSYHQAGGDAYLKYDRIKLINQSRDFYRNNSIYKGMVDRAVSYMVGNGFTLQVQSGSPRTNAKIEGLWKRFWRRPEIRGLLSGADVSQTVCRELILCGDTGAIKTKKAVLQLTEAEQLDGGKMGINGIEKDLYGTPVRYYLCSYDKDGYIRSRSAKVIRPIDFVFVTCPDRPSATRGVPACQSAFALIHRINDICDAEAIAWQVISRLALSINQKDGVEQNFIESSDDEQATSDAPITDRFTELDYALIFRGDADEEVKGVERNIPSMNFTESLRTFLRLMGLPLGLPLELILLDWSKSNYSQSRAVLEQAYQTFIVWQQKLDDFFYSEILNWKLEHWKQTGALGNTNISDLPYTWIKPTFPWIDQLKEAQACGSKVDRGFMSHSEVCKSLGRDRDDVVDAREREVRNAIERSKRIAKQTGENVPWQLFAGLEVTGSVKTAEEPEPNQDDQSKKEDDDA